MLYLYTQIVDEDEEEDEKKEHTASSGEQTDSSLLGSMHRVPSTVLVAVDGSKTAEHALDC